MRALILSCNTGGGHNAAARAMAEAFRANGDEAVVLDYLKLAGEKVSKRVGDVYVETVKNVPGVFGLVYKLGMLVSRLLRRSPVYYVNGIMAKYLRAYLKEHPADVILMPHLYPAETITYMKRKGMKLPLTVAVMTDYTCIPFWEETDCDYYVIPHESLAREIIRRGIPEEKLYAAGIPVVAACGRDIGKTEAKKELGLDVQKRYILMAGGSMGAGSMGKLVSVLLAKLEEREHLLLICGNNRKLKEHLQKRYGGSAQITVLGSVNNMPLYLKACDVVYTKPGGLTSTEAAVVGIPIVHTKPIPGCETKNRRFFRKNGMSVVAYTERGLAKAGLKLLREQESRKRLIEAQNCVIAKDSAQRIYSFVAEKTKEPTNA